MQKKEFKIKFRGIRGSYPVCSKNQVEYGGNTACVELLINGRYVILDGGTGIINLGNDLVRDYISSGTDIETRKPIEATILCSHPHLDHIQGLPFFKPVYIKSSNINLFGLKTRNRDFEQILTEAIFDYIFPVELHELPAKITVRNVHESEVILLHPGVNEPEIKRLVSEKDLIIPENTIAISCLKCYSHPKDGVMIYKISCNGKSIIYATDKEGYIGGDSRLTNFARNADVLIHDAQYTTEDYVSPISPKQGFGHSTPEMAIETARQANVRQLVLFHLDPNYDDETLKKIEEKTKRAFPETVVAHEGLEIDLFQVTSRK